MTLRPLERITFDRHVEDLELLRQELGLETMTVVGHSMGAILAGAYASKYPARIKRLVLMSPAHLKRPFPDADKPLLDRQNASLETFVNRPEVDAEVHFSISAAASLRSGRTVSRPSG